MFNMITKSERYKEYSKDSVLELTFFPEKDEEFIHNDFDIKVDSIKIYKNVGIGFYLNNEEIKFIECMNVEVKFEERFNCFRIRYNNSFEDVLEDKDIDFKNKDFYVRYAHDFFPDRDEIKYDEIQIGEKVVSCNLPVPIKDKHINIYSFISNRVLSLVFGDEIFDVDKIYEEVKPFINMINYEVIRIIDRDKDIYEIKLIDSESIEHLKKDELHDESKLISHSYSLRKNIRTEKDILEMIKFTIKVYCDKHNKKRED